MPLGSVVNLRMVNETEGQTTFNSAPLAGTFESSTATATTMIPHALSRFSVEAGF